MNTERVQNAGPQLMPSRPMAKNERLVPARLRGVAVQVPCPAWCRLDHVEANELFPEDIYHQGATVALPAPAFGGAEDVLLVDVRQTPFSGEHDGEPYLALNASGGDDAVELPLVTGLAFADQLVAHAEAIRSTILGVQSEVGR